MRRLGLRAKLLVSFVLILIPVVGLLAYGYREAYERRINTVLGNQLQTAQALAVLVDTNFDEALSLGWALADDPIVRTFDPDQVDPHLQLLLSHYPQYHGLSAFNAAGDNVGATLPSIPGVQREGFRRERLIADRPYFQQLMATGRPLITPVVQARALVPPTFVANAGVPIRDQAGNTIGAVLVGLHFKALSERIATIGLGPGQDIFLVDAMGTAAFYTAIPGLASEQRNLSDFEPVRAAIAGGSTTLRNHSSPFSNETQIGAYVPTPKYGWVVGVTMNEGVATAPVRMALRDQLAGFGGVILLSVALALLASYGLIRPIRRLTRQALALGRGDQRQRVAIDSGDELEQLGGAFNEMAERLGRSLGDLQAVLEATESDIVMYDRNTRVRVLTRRMAEWFGFEPAKAIGQRFGDVVSEHIAPALAWPKTLPTRLDRELEHPNATVARQMVLEEVEVVRPEYRVLRRYVGPVYTDGQNIGYIEVYTDITELRRRETERQALGQVASALVREVTLERVAEVVVEQGQRVLKADAAVLFLAELEREELVLVAQRGLTEQTVKELEKLPFAAPSITAKAARTGLPQEVADIAQVGLELSGSRSRAKREGQHSLFAQPLIAKDHLVGVFVLDRATPHLFLHWERELARAFADLCTAAVENARLYKELQETIELREEFISAAAHELKTPVTTIKGYVQAMRKWAPEGHEPREDIALDAVNRQCDRITQRVHEMLEAVRLRRAPLEQAKASFDLGDLAAEVLKRLQATTDKHRLVLVRAGAFPVEADRERIEEVLASLVDNAIKFSPKEGDVEVQLSTGDREAIVAVRDFGVGIALERQAHIFEPFYEPVQTGAAGYRGVAALSLYLSKLIVERHKGRIWFESKEDKGSTFCFSLPLAAGRLSP